MYLALFYFKTSLKDQFYFLQPVHYNKSYIPIGTKYLALTPIVLIFYILIFLYYNGNNFKEIKLSHVI